MDNLDQRLTTLEADHTVLKSQVGTLAERIAVTESALENFRQDMDSGFQRIDHTLNNVTVTALKTWPPEAVEAIHKQGAGRMLLAILGADMGLILLILWIAMGHRL